MNLGWQDVAGWPGEPQQPLARPRESGLPLIVLGASQVQQGGDVAAAGDAGSSGLAQAAAPWLRFMADAGSSSAAAPPGHGAEPAMEAARQGRPQFTLHRSCDLCKGGAGRDWFQVQGDGSDAGQLVFVCGACHSRLVVSSSCQGLWGGGWVNNAVWCGGSLVRRRVLVGRGSTAAACSRGTLCFDASRGACTSRPRPRPASASCSPRSPSPPHAHLHVPSSAPQPPPHPFGTYPRCSSQPCSSSTANGLANRMLVDHMQASEKWHPPPQSTPAHPPTHPHTPPPGVPSPAAPMAPGSREAPTKVAAAHPQQP